MKFRAIAIFSRSITIEMLNNEPYYSPSWYVVLLDGKKYTLSKRNVVSIYGLLPQTSYEISVIPYQSCSDLFADTIEKQTFTTKYESAFINVLDFGAKRDGKSDDAPFIQAAIMACPDNGTVFFPKGTYYSSPLFLKSNLVVCLDEDAILLGSTERTKYPILPGCIHKADTDENFYLASWEGTPDNSFSSLITAIDCKNIDIIGSGVINGNADLSDWWTEPKRKRIAWRPNTIFLSHCQSIRVQGLTIQNSPSWTIHPYYCSSLSFIDLDISSPYKSPNTDGIDPECSNNITIIGTRISVGDDCIAIKSGKKYISEHASKTTTDIDIHNCLMKHGHGSVTIGSEISCGANNICIRQCVFSNTDRGIRLKTCRGRGEKSVLTGIVCKNIIMKNVHMPVTVNMFYNCDPDGHSVYIQERRPLPVDERTPVIGTISFEEINCTGIKTTFVCVYGLPEKPVQQIVIKNSSAKFAEKNDQITQCPLMMDDLDPMKGKSIILYNVSNVKLINTVIYGADDHSPKTVNVDNYESDNLIYKNQN